ncbi:Protein of unknown function [Desulfurella multipotens]|uniref:DUF2726 domain-containing protein n=1 Tax=Desulfurella multipotens TaxID=79269 RepID=A0A1G6MAM4_9BACT|nr:DUF2726 domain-containing protein [Desulfurella multipotens]SDC52334.1 Protein of unknown function [Desulfurella multipotens]
MKPWYYISVLLIGFSIVFVLWLIRKFKEIKTPQIKKYTLKDYLLSKNERIVYEILLLHAKDFNLEVLPKMRLSEFIHVDRKNRNAFFIIQNKFVDFLIVDNVKIKPKYAIVIEKKNLKESNLELFENIFKEIKLKWILIKEEEFENPLELKEKLKKILEEAYA